MIKVQISVFTKGVSGKNKRIGRYVFNQELSACFIHGLVSLHPEYLFKIEYLRSLDNIFHE